MRIVELALARPYSFVVLSVVLLLISPVVLLRTPVDIFPSINIPVISVIWTYTGLAPSEMETRIVSIFERSLTTSVNNIEHIESQSLNGVAVIKVFLQPTANIDGAISEVIAEAQVGLKQFPPGITPPLVLSYDASSVPILQLGLSGKGMSEQQLNDLGVNFIRPQLATIQGASVPIPYGGKVRQVMVDIDSHQLMAKGLSPLDVVNAVNAQNVILPSGTAKIGRVEYNVGLNGSPSAVDALNHIPVKAAGGGTIYMQDVAQVRDGYAVQQNIVRQDGQRGVLLGVQKSGNASTLSIVSQIYKALPQIKATLPPQLVITPQFDQSLFVRASLQGVVREAGIAALLTSLMILMFLGSWRSTLIIAISIPLSIVTSLLLLSALGQSINIMTLGGLALAVGILVDDATVTIENVERQLASGERLEDGILKGAGEIALPAMVSTFCICIVFVPMFSLAGVARYLFVPLAEAVMFAVISSYVLSRTLVPTMIMFFERHHHKQTGEKHVAFWVRPLVALQQGFEKAFDRFREAYANLLGTVLGHRAAFVVGFLSFCVATWLLVPFLGQNFFPAVDAGTFRLHVRAPTGTRIEQTAKLVDEVEAAIRREVPANEMEGILDNIGLPVSGINLSYNDSGISGPADADILVSLKPNHKPTANYVRNLRLSLNRDFPGTTFYFLPADIVSQTLNFGLPAPLDIQVVGRNQTVDQQVANSIAQKIRQVRGAVDVRVQQPNDLQRFEFNVDRTKAMELGLSERDVAGSVLLSLSGSSQVTPTYWLDYTTGVQYLVNVRVPERQTTTLSELRSMPLSASKPGTGNGQILDNVTDVTRITSQPIYTHYNVIPVVDVYGGVGARDLGGVLSDIMPIVAQAQKTAPQGVSIVLRGQAATMSSSFLGLGIGMLVAIALVYLLLVVNFQSWLDPFIILTALTGALAGVIWGLHVTSTTLSVPAMMGAIMCLGVATANSVLVVTFARTHLQEGMDSVKAAWEAGTGRLRPVIMTATAMIIGMLPMALGLGEGGEQNAPLGRAVIGGLMLATVATLLFVPVVFSLLHRQTAATSTTDPKENVSSTDLKEVVAVT